MVSCVWLCAINYWIAINYRKKNKKQGFSTKFLYEMLSPSMKSDGWEKANLVSLFCLAEGEMLTLTESQKYNPPG